MGILPEELKAQIIDRIQKKKVLFIKLRPN